MRRTYVVKSENPGWPMYDGGGLGPAEVDGKYIISIRFTPRTNCSFTMYRAISTSGAGRYAAKLSVNARGLPSTCATELARRGKSEIVSFQIWCQMVSIPGTSTQCM